MFEYKDNFFLGQSVDFCEAAANYVTCNIRRESAEEYDELARLVGEGSKLESGDDELHVDEADLPSWTEATEADVPRLEFDLEDELTRAFDGHEAAEETNSLGPDFGERALQEALEVSDPEPAVSEVMPTADLTAATKPSVTEETVSLEEISPLSIPVSETETLTFDDSESNSGEAFSGLVSQEIEKALGEFDAEIDSQPSVEVDEPAVTLAAENELVAHIDESAISEDSLEDFSMELARLMGEPDAAEPVADTTVTEAPTPSVAPAPSEAVMPWEAPEIIQQAAPGLDEVASIEPASVHQTPAFQAPFTSPPHFPHAAPLEVPEFENTSQVEDVLARAGAVEAAAARDTGLDDEFDDGLEAVLSRELDAELDSSNEEMVGGPHVIPPIYMPGAERIANRPAGRRIAAGVAVLALLGGSAALAWNFVSSDTAEPPTILASNEPVKVKPKETGGKVVPNQDQSVYTAVDGKDAGKPKQDVLKDASEKPIAVAKAPVSSPSTNNNVGPSGETTDPQTTGGPIVAPRRVRTVVVRPDGTILTKASTAKPQTAAQEEIALAASPEAPKPVSVKTTTQPAETETAKLQPKTQISAVKPKEPAKPAVEPRAVKTEAVPKVAKKAPAKPAPKPVKVTKVEPPKPAVKKPVEAAATDPLAPATVSSPYKVQVSSQRTQDAAQKSYQSLAQRFAGVIGGKGVDYQSTKVKGKDYVRVRIPAQSKAEAQRICSQLKSRGGDCFVTR